MAALDAAYLTRIERPLMALNEHMPADPSAASVPARITGADAATARRLADYARAARGAFAPSTERAIRGDTRRFAEWAEAAGHPATLPVPPETVAAYVDAMAASLAPATVSRYVASLNHLHRAAGHPVPGSAEVVRLALRRMRRAKGTAQRQAKGLTRDRLDLALARLDGGPLLHVRDAALLALAYDTLARSAELVAFDVADLTPDGTGGATAHIRRSKTDQEGEGRHAYVAPDTWRRVKAWIAAADLAEGDALFSPHGPASTRDRLSTGDVRRIFKRHLGARYSGHSARVGATQDATAAGIDVGATAQSGGWKDARMPLRYGAKVAARRSGAARLAHLQGRG